GVEGALLAGAGEDEGELAAGGARGDVDGQIRRIVTDGPTGCAHLHRVGGHLPADLPVRPRPDRDDTPRARHRLAQPVDRVGGPVVAHTHVPSGTRGSSPQRLPRGSTLVGFARPAGSKASRSRAWASRSSGVKTRGIASRFSRPMPCSPLRTPPA